MEGRRGRQSQFQNSNWSPFVHSFLSSSQLTERLKQTASTKTPFISSLPHSSTIYTFKWPTGPTELERKDYSLLSSPLLHESQLTPSKFANQINVIHWRNESERTREWRDSRESFVYLLRTRVYSRVFLSLLFLTHLPYTRSAEKQERQWRSTQKDEGSQMKGMEERQDIHRYPVNERLFLPLILLFAVRQHALCKKEDWGWITFLLFMSSLSTRVDAEMQHHHHRCLSSSLPILRNCPFKQRKVVKRSSSWCCWISTQREEDTAFSIERRFLGNKKTGCRLKWSGRRRKQKRKDRQTGTHAPFSPWDHKLTPSSLSFSCRMGINDGYRVHERVIQEHQLLVHSFFFLVSSWSFFSLSHQSHHQSHQDEETTVQGETLPMTNREDGGAGNRNPHRLMDDENLLDSWFSP